MVRMRLLRSQEAHRSSLGFVDFVRVQRELVLTNGL